MERESSCVSISSPSPPRLVRPSRSFRLRSPSLNTLRLRRVFDLFDRDSDGQITVVELSQALDRLGLGADPSDLATTVSSFIRPGCQGLEFEDFEALHREIGDSLFGFGSSSSIGEEVEDEDEADVEGDMEEAFRVFDVDGDGFISANELYTVLGKMGLGEGLSIARVHDMIYSVDKNRDGRVDFGEFKDMMMGITLSGA